MKLRVFSQNLLFDSPPSPLKIRHKRVSETHGVSQKMPLPL